MNKRYSEGLDIFARYDDAPAFAILEWLVRTQLQSNHSRRGAGFRWLVAAATAKVVGFEVRSKSRCSCREC